MSTALFGFDPVSFEYFVQCISVHAIGPDIVVFGRGRDGAREASFRGSVKIPGRDDTWNGHIIVQAKCKEKTEGTKLDQEWALTQLKAELAKLSKKKGRNRPDYYIFATNVTLTPVEGSGGKDRASEAILSYTDLPLKGFALWDQSQIDVFLGAYQELRTRFSTYLTPSDVLSRLLKGLEAHDRELSAALQRYLQASLLEDRDARLDQAGSHTDDRTSLADVFVDLKANPKGLEALWGEDAERSSFILQELMNVSSLPLVRQELNNTEGSSPSMGGSNLNSRYVLIGGPGSGKSTVGQVLCQIHRAALVQSGFSTRTGPEQKSAAAAIRLLCQRESVSWPARPRIPFRIELSAFATALASKQWSSATVLADYLARQTLGEGLARGQVILEVMQQYPSIIVLDGLDEVPASSNREQVVQAIQRLISDADVAGCDLLIVGSTRPDGYGGEFGHSQFEYRYVQNLEPQTALRYARLYLEKKFGDTARTSELLERLQHALGNDLTAKLMRSPLQVTFMATLVAAGGSPPRERWRLFHDYFDTIYKREQQKAREVRTRDVLSKRRLLEAIHHDVGFLLQYRSEHTGGTESMMKMEVFQTVVDGHLSKQGWKGPPLRDLRETIRLIATDRLVFLSSRVAGRISFDIRSLQEYMAAERLMTGPDEKVIARIRSIAGFPYWRNVLLFAVGQMFGDPRREHLIDSFFGVCKRLNSREVDAVTAALVYGARLALDTIVDGALDSSPAYSDIFIELALELLRCPVSLPTLQLNHLELELGEQDWERLAKAYSERHKERYRERIEDCLRDPCLEYRMPSIMLLAELTNRGFRWAERILVDALNPEGAPSVAVLLVAERGGRALSALSEYRVAALQKAPLAVLLRTRHYRGRRLTRLPELDFLLDVTWASPHAESVFRVPVAFEHQTPLHLTAAMRRVQAARDRKGALVEDVIREARSYSAFCSAVPALRFILMPSAETLAEMLMSVAEGVVLTPWHGAIPWPGLACIAAAQGEDDLLRLAEAAMAGDLGDTDTWITAESGWMRTGKRLRTEPVIGKGLPFTVDSLKSGIVPCGGVASFSLTRELLEDPLHLESVQTLLVKSQDSTVKRLLANLAAQVFFYRMSSRRRIGEASSATVWVPLWAPDQVRMLFEAAGEYRTLLLLGVFNWPETLTPEWVETISDLGMKWGVVGPSMFDTERRFNAVFCELSEASFVVEPSRLGILSVLACFAVAGWRCKMPRRLLELARYADLPMKRWCVLLLLSHQNLIAAEARVLAQEAIAGGVFQRSGDSIRGIESSIVRVLDSRGNDDAAIAFLLEIMSSRVPDAVAVHADMAAQLQGALRRRSSGLGTIARCQELMLPVVDDLAGC